MIESLRPNKHDAVWTKVLIYHNDQFSKDEIFDEIFPILFDHCNFYPCYYKRYPKRDEFFLYKNFDALKSLAARDLKVTTMHNKSIQFMLLVDVADFDEGSHPFWYKKLTNELAQKRIIGNTLDLNGLRDNPDSWSMAIPVNLSHNLNFIIDMARKQNPRLDTVLAQKNSIRSLEGQFIAFPGLLKLDMRNNEIRTLAGICETTAVTEVLVDGNPLCIEFESAKAMVASVKSHFGNLEWLDGCRVEAFTDMITFQNFISDSRKCSLFAHEFVKDFFFVYDSFERKKLMQFYNNDSIMTISAFYEADKTVLDREFLLKLSQQLTKYTKLSRNLMFISDLSKAKENFYQGKKVIEQVFEHLPQTSHDCTNFCIDVPLITSREVMITVTGAFEEKNSNFQLAFTRTFILKPSTKHQYIIANEQLLIRQPTLKQKENFVPRMKMLAEEKVEHMCADLMPNESEEKRLKVVLYKELTGATDNESTGKLQECQWDLKAALISFQNSVQ